MKIISNKRGLGALSYLYHQTTSIRKENIKKEAEVMGRRTMRRTHNRIAKTYPPPMPQEYLGSMPLKVKKYNNQTFSRIRLTTLNCGLLVLSFERVGVVRG